MFRKKLVSEKKKQKDPITWRGHEITRIEAFSDAVFAFAITLLIMSLEVPKTYPELIKIFHLALPFGICFAITMVIWYHQNLYFRRFGLHDVTTILLNCILVFLVLIYMFPLKFLIGSLLSPGEFKIETGQQIRYIYSLYCGGFAAFYLLFALMYLNAYFKRASLKLANEEIFSVFTSVYVNLVISVVSFAGCMLALTASIVYSYSVFILIGPAIGILTAKREKIFKSRFPDVIKKSPISEDLEAIPDDAINKPSVSQPAQSSN